MTEVGKPDAQTSESAVIRAEALNLEGVRLYEAAQYQAAAQSLLEALGLQHDYAEAHLNLARVYAAQGSDEDALDSLYLATHFDPASGAAWIQLARMLVKLGRHDEAEAACRQALTRDAQRGEAWMMLGNVCKARNDIEAAIANYRKAIASAPSLAGAHCRLGLALQRTGGYDEARTCLETALALEPRYFEARHNLGLLLYETGRTAEALAEFHRALAIRPGVRETLACVAHALRELGRLDEAIAQYDAVLAQQPDFADVVVNRAYALLMRGDYAGGWAGFERRFACGAMQSRRFPYPQWRGEPLRGRRILVYAEQGLGDEIMFASCLPDLMAVAQHCVIECNTRLAPLFQRSFPDALVHGGSKDDDKSWLKPIGRVDVQASIGSLPAHFRLTSEDFPRQRAAYIRADPVRIERWRGLLGGGATSRVGIAWRGGSLRTRQLIRSLPLDAMLPFFALENVEFWSLQHGDVDAELSSLQSAHGVGLRNPGAAINDLDELAALVCALDLVISVDTTLAHLAGALGRPVWVLLSARPEWRYPRAGEAMPWYPSARLFHQHDVGEWGVVVGHVARELSGFVARRVAG